MQQPFLERSFFARRENRHLRQSKKKDRKKEESVRLRTTFFSAKEGEIEFFLLFFGKWSSSFFCTFFFSFLSIFSACVTIHRRERERERERERRGKDVNGILLAFPLAEWTAHSFPVYYYCDYYRCVFSFCSLLRLCPIEHEVEERWGELAVG